MGLAIAASAAIAQDRPPGTPDARSQGGNFVALDADGDGVLSRRELAPMPELQRRFEAMDTNKDGTVSALEFSSPSTGALAPARMPASQPAHAASSSPSTFPGGMYP